MTKKALLFAGFALIGSSAFICSNAHADQANQLVPTDYKEWIWSLKLKNSLAKRISAVIEAGNLREGVKSVVVRGEIIKARPLHDIWSDDATQKALRLQLLEKTLRAVVAHQAEVLSQAQAKINASTSGGSGSSAQPDLISELGRAMPGTAEYQEIAKQLKTYQDKAREIVEDVEKTRSIFKENVEAGLRAGGASEEEIQSLKQMAENSEWKLENFVPGAFGVHVGFKLTQSMMEALRRGPFGIARLAKDADGSVTVTYLMQPWEVEVISSPLSGSGTPKIEKYLFIQGNKHAWVNRNQVKGINSNDPSTGRGFNIRGGFTFISGNVDDLATFFGGFAGVSFDHKSYINSAVTINVKAGTLFTNGESMTGNHYIMISPQYIKPGKETPREDAAVAVASAIDSDSSSSWFGRLMSEVRNYPKRSKARFNHGIVVPMSGQTISKVWDSIWESFRSEARAMLMEGGVPSSQDAPRP